MNPLWELRDRVVSRAHIGWVVVGEQANEVVGDV